MGQRSIVPLEKRCSGCSLSKWWCMCELIPKTDNQTAVVWIYHPLELLKTTSSTVLSRLSLRRKMVLQWEGRGDPIPMPSLDLSNAWVLMPEDGAIPIEEKAREYLNQKAIQPHLSPPVLIAIDGTWRQARRMVKKIPWLLELPKITVTDANPNPNILRRQHLEEGMSTSDAIALCLKYLGEEEASQSLLSARLLQMTHVLKTRGIYIDQRVEQLNRSQRAVILNVNGEPDSNQIEEK
jgi:DTW domain-containing protein YfiP